MDPTKMAFPALRQPKFLKTTHDTARRPVSLFNNYVILTLKNNNKLVLTSDAYHGIITEEEMFRCVFCATTMELNSKYLEFHRSSSQHKARMASVPYLDNFDEHLIRQINKNESYCTICNVTLPTYSVTRHTATESHCQELDKAYARGLEYKPS